ncbi:GNAT family N-acetyltransferase [Actinoplanes sp. NPDC049596]|uniref:GNAT family N-acetyltransferase n=1 Tax=unclassified Actinoplanes TaxID=2626549 RepID=UPI00341EE8EC
MRIRLLSELADLHEVYWLFDSIWHSQPGNAPVSRELLRAMSKAGNYVAGAYDDTGMIGACVGFFAAPERREVHSHVAGVTRAARGRSVGRAIKLHQRAWALGQGVTRISWTFDPLVRRNAFFNLVKLGAVPAQYLPDFYGTMGDAINGDDDTDRLLLHWDLTAPAVERAARGGGRGSDVAGLRAAGAVTALGRTPGGEPVAGTADGRTVLVAVPTDIETLRATDPACARRWRVAVRDALAPLIDEGARVRGFDRAGWYVLDRESR